MTLAPRQLQWAAWALAVDAATAAVIADLEGHGIDALLVKGPVIGRWLYAGEVRPYGDGDLVIKLGDWDAAVARLEALGFHDYLAPLGHPRMESQAGTGFLRGPHSIDLHATLPGLDASPDLVWQALWSRVEQQTVGGRVVNVPDRATVLMHVALHAAHHVEGKPIEDLDRALRVATHEQWRAAAALADELGGLAAFATGTRMLPDGEALVDSLGLSGAGSVASDLRAAQVPLAEGVSELLGASWAERPAIIVRELFPNAAFMRWHTPLARRGRLGLVASYPVRWLMLLVRAPAAVLTVRRVRRQRGE